MTAFPPTRPTPRRPKVMSEISTVTVRCFCCSNSLESRRDSSELLQQKQRTVTVEISDMTFGRLGVGRVGGKAVMVPFTAPGDLVEVELIREHKSYLEGRPLKVLRSSPSRRTA